MSDCLVLFTGLLASAACARLCRLCLDTDVAVATPTFSAAFVGSRLRTGSLSSAALRGEPGRGVRMRSEFREWQWLQTDLSISFGVAHVRQIQRPSTFGEISGCPGSAAVMVPDDALLRGVLVPTVTAVECEELGATAV
jgi:hypothetical protein